MNRKEKSLRHFIAYHNPKTMGYSCVDIPEPRVQTSRPVAGLDGVTVWLIAGEGETPKSYYLAAKFIADRCEPNSIVGSKFPNLIAGPGNLFKKTIPLNGSLVLEHLRRESANFVRGFYESKDSAVISGLKALT